MADIIAEIETLDPDAREQFLRLRTSAQKNAIIEIWAQTIKLHDLMLLPEFERHLVITQIVGDTQKGIPSSDRIFRLAPTEKGRQAENLRMQIGMNRSTGIRQFLNIRDEMTFPAPRAIQAMLYFGPSAPHGRRGLIEEVFEAAPKKKKRSKKKAKPKPAPETTDEG